MSRNIAVFLKELYYQLFIMHPDIIFNIKFYFFNYAFSMVISVVLFN